jgi:hypothetical protein
MKKKIRQARMLLENIIHASSSAGTAAVRRKGVAPPAAVSFRTYGDAKKRAASAPGTDSEESSLW